MKIIFLDDDERRQKTMKSLLPCIIQTFTTDETIKAIEEANELDCVFLDHDLGGEVYVDSSYYNTGMTVAKWLVENKKDICKIVLHSFNPVGTKNMYEVLKDEYDTMILPFLSCAFNEFIKEVGRKK